MSMSDVFGHCADSKQLRCDVQQDPYVACTRCRKTKIECRIDPNFRRVGKRKRNAEMEQELEQLRKKLANHEATGGVSPLHRARGPAAGFGHLEGPPGDY